MFLIIRKYLRIKRLFVQIYRNCNRRITPNTIILDVNDDKGKLFQTASINFVCNCTFLKNLILNNITTMFKNESSNFVNKYFINNLTKEEKFYLQKSFSRYVSKCQNQCENITDKMMTSTEFVIHK